MKRITLLTILVVVLVFIPLSGFYVDVEAGQIKYSITLGVLRFVDVLTAGLRKLAFITVFFCDFFQAPQAVHLAPHT